MDTGVSGSLLSPIAILLVCRNRRDTTVAAIRRLRDQSLAIPYTIVLFDDASTDGTVEAVVGEEPATVVVEGDGNAFWNGGLFRAWHRALDLPCNTFLWLNDDVELDSDAFARLAAAAVEMRERQGSDRFVLVGATRGANGKVTYSGLNRVPSPFAFRMKPVQPGSMIQRVDTFNGNIVLVPRAVVDQIGINDPAFHHNLGDMDYGLRVTRAGLPAMLLPNTLGYCEKNAVKSEKGFGAPKLTLREQWRQVNTHHGLPVKSWWHFTRRHSGLWFIMHFTIPYRRLFGIK